MPISNSKSWLYTKIHFEERPVRRKTNNHPEMHQGVLPSMNVAGILLSANDSIWIKITVTKLTMTR